MREGRGAWALVAAPNANPDPKAASAHLIVQLLLPDALRVGCLLHVSVVGQAWSVENCPVEKVIAEAFNTAPSSGNTPGARRTRLNDN